MLSRVISISVMSLKYLIVYPVKLYAIKAGLSPGLFRSWMLKRINLLCSHFPKITQGCRVSSRYPRSGHSRIRHGKNSRTNYRLLHLEQIEGLATNANIFVSIAFYGDKDSYPYGSTGCYWSVEWSSLFLGSPLGLLDIYIRTQNSSYSRVFIPLRHCDFYMRILLKHNSINGIVHLVYRHFSSKVATSSSRAK